jgi:UDP-2,4-diacetamido-2,4,6-trideoxy-beta-L-altropyranose hydrolase
MRILFRSDATIQLGAEHLRRCLSLAEKLREGGAEIWFASCESRGHPHSQIAERNFHVIPLSVRPFRQSFRLNEEIEDALELKARTQERSLRFDWVVVDHYALGASWEREMRSGITKVMSIDDLADRAHHCDILLDPNEFGNRALRYRSLVPKDTMLLLGRKFALLSPEALRRRPRVPQERKSLRALLVDYGTIDPTNETLKAARAIAELPELKASVLIGKHNTHDYTPLAGAKNLQFLSPDQYRDLSPESFDLLLCQGGIGIWERMALAVPMVATVVTEDQSAITEECEKRAYLRIAGLSGEVTERSILKWIKHFREMPTLLEVFSRNAHDAIDPRSTNRVSELLFSIHNDRAKS